MKQILLTLTAIFLIATFSIAQNIPSYVPTNGLVGWWPFNGNANDESGNGNNGTKYGATMTNDRNGFPNSAYYFNGSAQYITVPAIQSLNNATDATFSLWAKVNGNNGWTNNNGGRAQYFLSRDGDFQSTFFGIYFEQGNNTFVIRRNNGTGYNLNSVSLYPFPHTEWYHIVFSIGNGTMKLYVDGILKSSTGFTGNLGSSNSVINFGKLPVGGYEYYLNGYLDDIAIYNRALTQEEVTQLYNGTNTPCSITNNFISQDTIRVCSDNYTIDAGSGFSTYLWSNGGNSSSINVTQSGMYKCTVSNSSGCTATDSVYVSILKTNILQNDTAVCKGISVVLSNSTFGTINNFLSAHPDLSLLTQYNNHYYLLGNQMILWESANNNAKQNGIQLYVINSPEEEQAVYNSLPWKGDDGKHYWLGLYQDINAANYSEPSGGWKWVDGSPLTYSNWNPGEPNNAEGENYAQIEWLSCGIKWNDAGTPAQNGTQNSYPIYEIDSDIFDPILWSTGATTSTITVSPEQTTTYYCTIADGISSCRDSVVVTVINDNTSITESACNLYILPWGDSITTSGTYTHTYTNALGCDSTVTAHITINHSVAGASFNASGINTYTLPWGDTATQSGYYTHLYQNEFGCDSLVTAYVVINSPADSSSHNIGINVENPQRNLHIKDAIRLEPRNTPLNNPTKGDIYFDGSLNKLRVYDGTTWQNCW
jgi:hypothetical protein